jgi:CMP-N,N'-diacetyllegionaminic acid synthase
MAERLLFLIPARGGSKGLPGKNLLDVGGIPLVGRAARLGCAAARVLGSDSRIVCSTDDRAIADAARSWGAEVPSFRPAHLSSDGARSIDVVFHVLDELGEFDAVVLLQPTSPLTEVADVVGAVRLHQSSGVPVVSVCAAEHPAEWLFTIDDSGHLTRLLQSAELPTQRQGARASYRVNGAVYVSAPAALRRDDSFFGPQTRGFLMPGSRSVDVDTQLDLAIARTIVGDRVVRRMTFGRQTIGADQPCCVIASFTVPHDDGAMAAELVNQVAEAGADAVAVQSENATALDDDTYEQFAAHCRIHRLPLISTAWDEKGFDALTSRDVAALKLPSSALERPSLLRHVAQTQKPLFVSTAHADLSKLAAAVDTIEDAGCQTFVLLHSVDQSRHDGRGALLRLTTLRHAFGVPVGLSDCDDNDAIAGAAAALGASVLEKYVSATPSVSFGQMIRRIRDVESRLAGPTPQ